MILPRAYARKFSSRDFVMSRPWGGALGLPTIPIKCTLAETNHHLSAVNKITVYGTIMYTMFVRKVVKNGGAPQMDEVGDVVGWKILPRLDGISSVRHRPLLVPAVLLVELQRYFSI